jgi:hypothetical protein
LSEVKSKQATIGTLDIDSANQYETLRFGNIVAACLVVIFLGGYRLTKRMRRKNMVYGDLPEALDGYEDEDSDEESEDEEDDLDEEFEDESDDEGK